MNKQLLFALILAFTAILSVSAISASEINVTDSYTTSLVDDSSDVSVPLASDTDSSLNSVSDDSNVDNDASKLSLSSEEVLGSENSNTLSTNIEGSNVLASDKLSTIDLPKTVIANDVTKYYKGSAPYTATFFDINGNPLSNTPVTINVNGKDYTQTTDANGAVSLSVNLNPGTYKIVATNPVTGFALSTNFIILSTITASNVKKVYTDSNNFYATFYKSDGSVLAKKTIKFKLNGKKYKVKTNAKGVAGLSLKNLKKGKYTIVSYNKDGLTKTNSIKVYNRVKSSIVNKKYSFLKSDSKKIKVRLLNALGYAPSSGKVIKFTINGKTYSRSTNSKGIAKLKLPDLSAGVYTVKYSFGGTTYYKASSASNIVEILSSSTPTFTVKSGTSYNPGSNTFKLAVSSGSVPLQGRNIVFTLNGETHVKTTDSKGLVSLPFNLDLGTYTVGYSIDKESKISAKSGSTQIVVQEAVKPVSGSSGFGYWLFGGDMLNVNLNTLASKGTSDIFLNYYALSVHGQSKVESWISSANALGIRVHIWMQTFYNGGWVNPATAGSKFISDKINEAVGYAKIKGVSGIHFDYIRYPGNAYKTSGGTEAVSNFVKDVTTAIRAVNSDLILSAAMMPETTDNKYYYGQDYSVFSKYFDAVVPMIYKGNYKSGTSWIKSTTKWFVDNSNGAKVWSGLQGYVSDDNTAKLSLLEITGDVKAAINGGASGAIIFRWGLTNFVDYTQFKSSSSSSTPTPSPSSTITSGTTISISDILAGAKSLKTYYSTNKKLPSTVSAGGLTFTMPEFLYVMSQAISQIGNSNLNPVSVISGVSDPVSPSGDSISSNLFTSGFLTVANNVANYINSNNQAPNYASSDVGKIRYTELIDAFARILAWYGDNGNTLPNYVSISSSAGGSSSSISITGTGLNEVNTVSDVSGYLVSTKNCQVGASAIKAKVNELTSGLTTDFEKANAIFDFVRNKISYTFYYNTRYGASGTLSAGTGNCVDQAHLVIAMFRTAGLAARYVHGTCKFTSSGSTYGHVWAQVLVDGKWLVADASSSRNSLGNIVSWYTSSYTRHGIYSALSF